MIPALVKVLHRPRCKIAGAEIVALEKRSGLEGILKESTPSSVEELTDSAYAACVEKRTYRIVCVYDSEFFYK